METYGSNTYSAGWKAHLYSQVPLRRPTGDIRLLTIQPRGLSSAAGPPMSTAPVQCLLHLANLQHGTPSFSAVTHASDDKEQGTVTVNGAVVPVPRAVVELLEHLRQEAEPVTIWINTLCVNHDDLEERSAQLGQVRDIFTTATSSIVWLGPAADGSDAAMIALRELAEQQNEHWHQRARLYLSYLSRLATKSAASEEEQHAQIGPTTPPKLDLSDQLQSLRNSFQSLMDRPYWTRIWSLQELAFTARGQILCGTQRQDLDQFHLSANALDGVLNMATYSKWLASGTTPSSPKVLESIQPANFATSPAIKILNERQFFRGGRGWWSNAEHQLFSLLGRYHLSESDKRLDIRSEDPKDLVSALLGLSSDAEALGVTVDYTKTLSQVCLETTVALLRENPKVLQFCQAYDSADPDSPSWLIDWSKIEEPVSYHADNLYNACGVADHRYYRLRSELAGTIELKGVFVDDVQSVASANPETPDASGETPIALLFHQSLEKADSPYTNEQFSDSVSVPATDSVYITAKGYVGNGKNIQGGDTIAILYGSEVPFAMRKQPDGTYRVVGGVYVHGLMKGEFMRNALEEQWIRIS